MSVFSACILFFTRGSRLQFWPCMCDAVINYSTIGRRDKHFSVVYIFGAQKCAVKSCLFFFLAACVGRMCFCKCCLILAEYGLKSENFWYKLFKSITLGGRKNGPRRKNVLHEKSGAILADIWRENLFALRYFVENVLKVSYFNFFCIKSWTARIIIVINKN